MSGPGRGFRPGPTAPLGLWRRLAGPRTGLLGLWPPGQPGHHIPPSLHTPALGTAFLCVKSAAKNRNEARPTH